LLTLSADIPLVYGTHYQFRGNSTDLEWKTSFAMEGKSTISSGLLRELDI